MASTKGFPLEPPVPSIPTRWEGPCREGACLVVLEVKEAPAPAVGELDVSRLGDRDEAEGGVLPMRKSEM